MLLKRRAQSTLEYALVIAVVVGALVAMQVYVKRGVQGRLKSAADDIGEQYSPGNTTGTVTVSTITSTTESLDSGVTSTESSTTQSMISDDETAAYDQEYWGE